MRTLMSLLLLVAISLLPSFVLAGTSIGREHLELKGAWQAEAKEWGASNVIHRNFRVQVPKSWSCRRVRVELPGALHKCDAVVFVNGVLAGDILRPGYDGLDVTRLIKFGEKNHLRFLLTESGKETARGETKSVTRVHQFKKGPEKVLPRLSAYSNAFIADVFANTSWRKKRVDFEVEIDSRTQGRGNVIVEVLDSQSNRVEVLEKKLELKKGANRCVLSMPWDSRIVSWELSRPYLYLCKASLQLPSSQEVDLFGTFQFGCREVWREGKEIMFNGCKTHFRPTFTYKSRKWGLKFLQDIGYNVGFWGHSVDGMGFCDQNIYQAHDELGMGMFASMGAQDTIGARIFHRDEKMRKEFERFIRVQHRLTRNHPSLLVGIVSQMTICETGTRPDLLGQSLASGDRVRQIELACELHRKNNPNILYFSHADGTCGDMASANLYLNFTPLQEREEWLSSWATNGILPWCSIEFGQPYNGNFWKRGVFLPTEFLAMFYGDRAYTEEPDETLAAMVGSTQWRHNGLMKGDLLYKGIPLYWDLRAKWTRRINERWRAYGLNGGNLWFNLTEAYGQPPNGWGTYWRYYPLDKEVVGRPDWANEGYDIHRQGNLDFCAFLGGGGDFVDMTHAYWAGEKVEKQLVFIWDGIGEKTFHATWSAVDSHGIKIDGASVSTTLKKGEQVRLPISFVAPKVERRIGARLSVVFSGDDVERITDGMDIEIYPAAKKCSWENGVRLALLDPDASASEMLLSLGMPFRKIKHLAEVRDTDTHLVIGRDALAAHRMDGLFANIRKGLRVLVLRQTPEMWQRLGFRVQDVMSRDLFLRDTGNKAFSDVGDPVLSYWRGMPDYPNGPFGNVMNHQTQRGPRGSRRHTVAGLLLQTPERIGYTPMVVGGFNLDYSALLRFAPGGELVGDITYCTLDFEKRIGKCPAATHFAQCVFKDFFADRKIDVRGELVVCNEQKALANGFELGGEKIVYKASLPSWAEFRGVGLNDLRWTSGIKVRPLRGEGASEDGIFALRREKGKSIVYSQLPIDSVKSAQPAQAEKDEFKCERMNATYLDALKLRRLYARLSTNLGVGVAEDGRGLALRRALHFSRLSEYAPLPSVHVLGPFEADKDDSAFMLDTLWSETGEKMAIAGDFNPNIEFPLPQGGKANWRTMLTPSKAGVFNFKSICPGAKMPIVYAICKVMRRSASRAILRFGMDWRARIWCNGKEVFCSGIGSPRKAGFEVALDLKEGENVLAFKVGAGKHGFKMIGLLEREHAQTDEMADPKVDALRLYADPIPGFDPWEFVYW